MGKEINNLGNDSVGKLLFRLAVPAIAAQLVNMLYNLMDRIYIGHIPDIGAVALTGVGITFPIIMLIIAFSSLIGMGGAPLAAIRMGQGKYDKAEQILGNCFAALIGISVILTVSILLFGEKLLLMFGASDTTLPYALKFLNIYVCGTIFAQIATGLNSFISTQGFAKISMLTVVIGAVISIILAPILIFGFGMGVQGAAAANVIAQGISALWTLHFLLGKKTRLKILKKHMKIKKPVILPVLFLGLAPFVMQSTESLLNITFNSSLLIYGGDMAVGAITILFSLMQVLTLPIMGIAQGAQPIISYNYGAKNDERVKKTFTLLMISSLCVSTTLWLVIILFPKGIISFFTNDLRLMKTTVWAMRIYMATAFVMGAQIACQQTFIALGQSKSAVFLAFLRKIILLIPFIYLLPKFIPDKEFAVFLAEPIADFLAVTVTVSLFSVQLKKLLTKNSEAKKLQVN